jgi:peptide/nickel transport system substrate-binding protein
MRKSLSLAALAVLAGVLLMALAACGSDSDNNSSSSSSSSSGGSEFNAAVPASDQKKGGTLTVPSVESFQHLDPGQAYFQLDYMVDFAVHRSLYYYKPDNSEKAVPDLADGDPQVSQDGKTVTVKLKKGIKYGTTKNVPGVTGAEVKAADVKYAFERTSKPAVPNGYVSVYFPFEGGSAAKGIETPDDHTLVFKFAKPFGATAAKALVMPITMPVPERYAAKFDAKTPDRYDTHPEEQAFTGPYMIQSYSAGKSLTLVRNPNWDGATDTRPAYVDKIIWKMGADPTVRDRQVLDGQSMVNGDTLAASTVKRAATQAKDQISFSPLGNRYVSLNTVKKPFSDLNVRKAVAAVMDRRAMQLARGGQLVGDVATHFLPPGLPGFDQSGGMEGTGADFLKNPSGDLKVAQEYLKKAGFASGKYNGPEIVMYGDNASPGSDTTQIVLRGLEQLGFKVKLHSVEHSAFYDTCQTVSKVKTHIDICANSGWLPDFFDPYAMINAVFNGEAIVPQNNVNMSLFDDKQINAEMDKAAELTGDERAKAWGDVDRRLTELMPAVPWFWDKQANLEAKNVHGVIAKWNAAWDLSWTSIK